jgi:predicted Zn finger-like uncharacterized protein
MNIRCPHCGFAKEIPDNSIPPGANRVNCPQCGQSFPLDRPAVVQAQNFTLTAEAPTVICPSCKLQQPQMTHCGQCGLALAMSEATAVSIPYAGFWLRVVASIIDSLALFAIQMVCGILLRLTSSLVADVMVGGGNTSQFLILLLFNLVINWAYFVVFTGSCGQTLGKMALRIKVVRTDGSDFGYGRALLREVPGKFVSGLILGIGYLMVAFDERKQGLHDKIADSYVIKL